MVISLNSKLSGEWHPTKNGELTIHSNSLRTAMKVWWQCSKGHEWEATINNRARGQSCPFCGNKRVLAGFNDLATKHPLLASQWHPTKNDNLTPQDIVSNYSKKVWWQCDKGHEWEAIPNRRVSQTTKGCPVCAGQKVAVGYNDLKSTHPLLAGEWHPTKNNSLTPQEVSKGYDKKVWWLGSCNHEWEATPNARTTMSGTGCPVCSHRIIVTGENDLTLSYLSISQEWHPTKNHDLTPQEIAPNSQRKVWWQCSKGHEWEAYVYSRTGGQRGCPVCSSNSFASQGEKEIQKLLQDNGIAFLPNARNVISKGELDIYIPEHNIAIEFNGVYWHSELNGKDNTYHYEKWLKCKEQGIQLIQIWEDDWKRKRHIVESSLISKLNKYQGPKYFARKLTIVKLSKVEAQPFLEENHIQGYASGSYYFGLKAEDLLVAVLVLKKEQESGTFNIIRYATVGQVTGGFTKLLKYAERATKAKKIITFSDNCISDGKLYLNSGFIADKALKPDYMYLKNGLRQHKFNYRLKRFREDSSLIWKENCSEKELAKLNNIPRVWDAGKIRWIKNIELA